MEKEIVIGNKTINEKTTPFIAVEAGVNYYEIANKKKISLIEAALQMIKTAADNGADGIKFQTYKAGTLTIKNSPTYWNEKATQYEVFKKYDKFGEKEFIQMSKYAKLNNIVFFSTPFDYASADYLNDLMPVFKIASADITSKPFLKYIARKDKPIILSTGASTLGEIEEAVRSIEDAGNDKIMLLHCILSYPTKYSDANLNMIHFLKEAFPKYLIGYSDHTLPDEAMLVNTIAVLLGASFIEKHFTMDKALPGNDHYHAMDAVDLRKLVQNIKLLRNILGDSIKKPIKSEEKSRIYARRSLVAKNNIRKGTIITGKMLTQKRPGNGISPNMIDIIVGRRATKNIIADEQISWDNI